MTVLIAKLIGRILSKAGKEVTDRPMAMIECPECGRRVSDWARKCPECAHQLRRSVEIGAVTLGLVFFGIVVLIAIWNIFFG